MSRDRGGRDRGDRGGDRYGDRNRVEKETGQGRAIATGERHPLHSY